QAGYGSTGRVVRSSASVKETKPTPRCSSSWSVAIRSVTDRPQRSNRQTRTTSMSRRTGGFHQPLTPFPLHRSRVHLTDVQGDRPTTPGRVLPHRPVLHDQRLLIVGRNTGIPLFLYQNCFKTPPF